MTPGKMHTARNSDDPLKAHPILFKEQTPLSSSIEQMSHQTNGKI
jgi:hypothetical protein